MTLGPRAIGPNDPADTLHVSGMCGWSAVGRHKSPPVESTMVGCLEICGLVAIPPRGAPTNLNPPPPWGDHVRGPARHRRSRLRRPAHGRDKEKAHRHSFHTRGKARRPHSPSCAVAALPHPAVPATTRPPPPLPRALRLNPYIRVRGRPSPHFPSRRTHVGELLADARGEHLCGFPGCGGGGGRCRAAR